MTDEEKSIEDAAVDRATRHFLAYLLYPYKVDDVAPHGVLLHAGDDTADMEQREVGEMLKAMGEVPVLFDHARLAAASAAQAFTWDLPNQPPRLGTVPLSVVEQLNGYLVNYGASLLAYLAAEGKVVFVK